MENPWISENLNKSRRFGELVMIRGSLHLFNILLIIDLSLGLPQLTKFYSFFSLRNTLNLKSSHINILVLTKEIYRNIYTTVYEHSYDRTCNWKLIIAWSCNRSYLFFFFFTVIISFWQTQTTLIFYQCIQRVLVLN